MNETLEYLLNLAADVTGVRCLPDVLIHPCDDVTLPISGLCQTQAHTCGAVAGLMVLHYFRPRASAEAFFRSVNPSPENGTGDGKLVRALRKFGLRVEARSGMAFADIAAAIDDDKPVLVTVKTRDPMTQHWVVCYGYGRRPNRLFLAGTGLPLVSRKEYLWADFRRKWTRIGKGLVCARRKASKLPAAAKKGRLK